MSRRIVTDVLSTDRTQRGLYTRPRSILVVIEGQNYLRYCRVSVQLGRGKSLICITVE